MADLPGGLVPLGATIDDAAGEAYDKVARLLGMPFPGGPPIDAAAAAGDPAAIGFPRGKYRDQTFDFSFSGLKTAVARWVEAREAAGLAVPVADVAASFQEAVVDVLTRKAVNACRANGVDQLVIGGGVAANSRLRALAQQQDAYAGRRGQPGDRHDDARLPQAGLRQQPHQCHHQRADQRGERRGRPDLVFSVGPVAGQLVRRP